MIIFITFKKFLRRNIHGYQLNDHVVEYFDLKMTEEQVFSKRPREEKLFICKERSFNLTYGARFGIILKER